MTIQEHQDVAQPGWYVAAGDPPGTHRFWDGGQWVTDPEPIANLLPYDAVGAGFDHSSQPTTGNVIDNGQSVAAPAGHGHTNGNGNGANVVGHIVDEAPLGLGVDGAPLGLGVDGAPLGLGVDGAPVLLASEVATVPGVPAFGVLHTGPHTMVAPSVVAKPAVEQVAAAAAPAAPEVSVPTDAAVPVTQLYVPAAQEVPEVHEDAITTASHPASDLQSGTPSSSATNAQASGRNPLKLWARWLSRWSDYGGRSSRAEFWWGLIVNGIVLGGLAAAGYYAYTQQAAIAAGIGAGAAAVVLSIGLLAGVASAVRRLHDTNQSGWWIILGVVPVVWPVLLYWYVRAGDLEANSYGESPHSA